MERECWEIHGPRGNTDPGLSPIPTHSGGTKTSGQRGAAGMPLAKVMVTVATINCSYSALLSLKGQSVEHDIIPVPETPRRGGRPFMFLRLFVVTHVRGALG